MTTRLERVAESFGAEFQLIRSRSTERQSTRKFFDRCAHPIILNPLSERCQWIKPERHGLF